MSFASSLDKETPQSLWAEQEELGGRIITTIPFGVPVDKMQGFISVIGNNLSEDTPFPVLTVCVEKPASGGAIVSTVVFPSQDIYLDFIENISTDAYYRFVRSKGLVDN